MTYLIRTMTLAAAMLLVASSGETMTLTTPTGTIAGVLRDTSGAVLDEASIRLRNPGSRADLQATLTDSAGRYVFEGVAGGTYDLFVIVPAATALSGANPRRVTVEEHVPTHADFSFTLLPVSFSRHVQPVLRAACTGCHSPAGGAPLGLTLTPRRARVFTVGVPSAEQGSMQRIQPRRPDASYLVHKIQGTQVAVGGSGAQMPQGFPPLPRQTIRMIRRWVAQGALQN